MIKNICFILSCLIGIFIRFCYIYFTLLFRISSIETVGINLTNKMNERLLLRRSYKGTYFSLAGKEKNNARMYN